MSRSLPAASNGTMQGGAPAKQPVAELLLANLRLLDLDLRADWPDVTAKTFSTKDTQQNQKQRIKCTEWILYRLFELWDSEETRDVCFPHGTLSVDGVTDPKNRSFSPSSRL